jgi:hypothetical protein
MKTLFWTLRDGKLIIKWINFSSSSVKKSLQYRAQFQIPRRHICARAVFDGAELQTVP